MIVCEIELEESPIPDGVFRNLDEVIVKADGCIWRVHKNDADPFLSNPHAHNLEGGLKLDLSNGRLYWRTRHDASVSRKNLLKIRELIQLKGVTLPTLTV